MNKEQEKIIAALKGIKPFLSLSVAMKEAHNDLIKRYNEIESQTPTAAPIDAVNVGDIFVCEWGYNQTNVDFYQVTRKTKKTIAMRAIHTKIVKTGDFYDEVTADVDVYSEESISRKKVNKWDDILSVNIGSFGKSAVLWNGKNRKQTAFCRGH